MKVEMCVHCESFEKEKKGFMFCEYSEEQRKNRMKNYTCSKCKLQFDHHSSSLPWCPNCTPQRQNTVKI